MWIWKNVLHIMWVIGLIFSLANLQPISWTRILKVSLESPIMAGALHRGRDTYTAIAHLGFGALFIVGGPSLNINRKAYMGSPLVWLQLTSVTLKGQCQSHFRFWNFISRKGAQVGHMVLLNINRKAYKGSPMTLSHLTSVTWKGQYQGHSDFKGVCLVKQLS